MKIDSRRSNLPPAPLPFEARGILERGSLSSRLTDVRVVPDGDRPCIARARSKKVKHRGFQTKNLKLTKARLSKLQEAAIKVSGFIDTLKLTSGERTDLYATLLYAHVKNAQRNIGELTGLECVLERFSHMVGKLLANTKVRYPSSWR